MYMYKCTYNIHIHDCTCKTFKSLNLSESTVRYFRELLIKWQRLFMQLRKMGSLNPHKIPIPAYWAGMGIFMCGMLINRLL